MSVDSLAFSKRNKKKMILIFNPFLSDFFRKKLFEIIIANAPL